MKTCILGLVLLLTGTATVNSGAPPRLEDIIQALRTGDAAAMARHFDDHIDVMLPEKTENYSKAQALMVLKDFFMYNGVKGFDVKQKNENSRLQYCTGTLFTYSGNYRTTLFMTIRNGRALLQEIRFQPK